MFNDEHRYLQRRAEAELDLAQRATHGKVAAAHHQMAEAYLNRAASLEPPRPVRP
ncbi:MAG TPA: hypothetical protein VF592_05195 [Sphingomonas sp.]|jgi:hypothetical protein|uniref:hypothetical protein n=1 Tax=Sphingomonas sp. TaxID=28214 RepID=UPI002EDBB12E